MTAGSIKNVAFVVDSLGLSGKTRTMALVATHLDSRRFRSVVFTFCRQTSILSEQLKARGIAIHYVGVGEGCSFGNDFVESFYSSAQHIGELPELRLPGVPGC